MLPIRSVTYAMFENNLRVKADSILAQKMIFIFDVRFEIQIKTRNANIQKIRKIQVAKNIY